jgi:hypothetical protein
MFKMQWQEKGDGPSVEEDSRVSELCGKSFYSDDGFKMTSGVPIVTPRAPLQVGLFLSMLLTLPLWILTFRPPTATNTR